MFLSVCVYVPYVFLRDVCIFTFNIILKYLIIKFYIIKERYWQKSMLHNRISLNRLLMPPIHAIREFRTLENFVRSNTNTSSYTHIHMYVNILALYRFIWIFSHRDVSKCIYLAITIIIIINNKEKSCAIHRVNRCYTSEWLDYIPWDDVSERSENIQPQRSSLDFVGRSSFQRVPLTF